MTCLLEYAPTRALFAKHRSISLALPSGLPLELQSQVKLLYAFTQNVLVEGSGESLLFENSKLMPLQRLCFEVSSMGIASAQLEKTFQSFKQFGSAQDQPAGAGLGLAIGQQGVNLIGRKLKVASQRSKGSNFCEGTFLKVVAPPVAPIYHPAQPFCMPPAQETEVWYELEMLEMLESVQNIRERATYPEQQDDRYILFPSMFRDSVQRFPEKAIATLVETYLYPERNL